MMVSDCYTRKSTPAAGELRVIFVVHRHLNKRQVCSSPDCSRPTAKSGCRNMMMKRFFFACFNAPKCDVVVCTNVFGRSL